MSKTLTQNDATGGVSWQSPFGNVSSETRYFVSTGPKASDSNDGLSWSTAFATIGAAVAARGANSGIIFLGKGTFTISVADTNGNGVTQSTPGQFIVGAGVNQTTVNLNANLTWGLKCTAQFCGFSDMLVQIPSGKTVTYGTGVGTPTSTGSAQSCEFTNVYVGIAGTTTATFALGPDWPGSGSVDIANTTFRRCVSSGPATHGFLVGNGTTANVLQNSAYDCQVVGAQHAYSLAGGGITVFGGGTNSISASDIYITHGAGEAMSFNNMRCEGGKRFLDVGYVGPTYGLTIKDCFAGGYTNTDNIIISYAANGPLRIVGGSYDCGTSTSVVMNPSGASSAVNSLDAYSVVLANTSDSGGWPAFNPTSYLRSIRNAHYTNSGIAVPSIAFRNIVDSLIRTNRLVSSSTTLDGSDDVVIFNGTSLTATLPANVPVGKVFTIANYNASSLSVIVSSGGNINGTATTTLAQNAHIAVINIGSGFWVLI